MPKFNVNYDVRHYNGSIEVEADTEEAAEELVENMEITKLLENTCDVAVDVESAEPA